MGNLERRIDKLLHNLESKEALNKREPDVTTDEVLEKLGLDPSQVREEAQNRECSLAEVVCRHLGLEVLEFKRLLRERANLQ